MTTLDPILSAPDTAPVLNIGGTRLVHRIRSDQTDGALAVVEFVSEPGEGVDIHIHENEDELVYLLEGEITVAVGDTSLTVREGACALLPREIPHGFVNTGPGRARLLAVLLPGALDGFFVALDHELAQDRPHEEAISRLWRRFGLRFPQPTAG